MEDNLFDRELARDALAADDLVVELCYAATKEEFAAALAAREFQLILSDFSMPGYDGASALALVQQKCPDVPFIFISGTIGEERAIESLRNGATDYILKEHPARLLPAVRRALREANERTRRRTAEAALRQAEARYRSIFENAVEGIYQATPDGRLIDANLAMARLCGDDSPRDFCERILDLGRDLYVISGRRSAFAKMLDEKGEVLGHESQIRRRDGAVIWIAENARAVRGANGELEYYEGMATDITDRKAAEDALRESEERFRVMAESIDVVFWISSDDGERLLYVSPAYEQIWGRPVAELQAQPKQWLDAIVPEDRPAMLAAREALAGGREYRIEYRIYRPDKSVRWIEDRSYPIHRAAVGAKRAVGVATDITRRKELESQLLQAQKMEAVGQLAGGLAHDFNNVLTVVTGYSRLLLDGGTMPPDAVKPLSHIFTAGSRAANLTRQLLVFSRKQTINRSVFDLNRVAEEIVEMLRRLIGEHIRLELTLSPQPCPADADESMVEQALMNLAVNARDAMHEGGVLTIGTARVQVDNPATRHHPDARTGEFVCLSVQDTGCGIPPENLSRIFEPFFSTKDVGHGTGLGLAMVFGIAQQHQGWIELESAVGAGTCFRVLLPAAGATPAAQAHRPVKAAAHGGSETMLLVEDEPAVREFAVAVLRGQGYRVLQAGNAQDALDAWKWHGPRIAMLFSDLVLPDGMGGLELATVLRKDKPTLKVVLTSGYASTATGEAFRPPPGTHFIHKPYKPQTLTQVVRNALDGTFNH